MSDHIFKDFNTRVLGLGSGLSAIIFYIIIFTSHKVWIANISESNTLTDPDFWYLCCMIAALSIVWNILCFYSVDYTLTRIGYRLDKERYYSVAIVAPFLCLFVFYFGTVWICGAIYFKCFIITIYCLNVCISVFIVFDTLRRAFLGLKKKVQEDKENNPPY